MRKTINDVTEYDQEKGLLTISLKALFGAGTEDIERAAYNVKRLIVQQLADEWIRQNGSSLMGDFTKDDLARLMKEEVLTRFMKSLLSR